MSIVLTARSNVRGKSIIFGADNYLAGRPVDYDKEAAEYAKR